MELPSPTTVASYVGMVLTIIAIRPDWVLASIGIHNFSVHVFEKTQRILFFVGPLLLFFGAIGLKNEVLIASQAVIGFAGVLGLLSTPKKLSAALTVLTGVTSFYYLYYRSLLGLDWSLVGALGFLAIALGIAASLKKPGAGLLALGGMLMFAYSWAFWAIPWIILNIPFTLVALSALFKKTKQNDEPDPLFV